MLMLCCFAWFKGECYWQTRSCHPQRSQIGLLPLSDVLEPPTDVSPAGVEQEETSVARYLAGNAEQVGTSVALCRGARRVDSARSRMARTLAETRFVQCKVTSCEADLRSQSPH